MKVIDCRKENPIRADAKRSGAGAMRVLGPGPGHESENSIVVMVMVARVKSGVASEETLSRDVSNFMFKIILRI